MELVNCTREFWEFVRTLRMDTRVAEGFIQSADITPHGQIAYMKEYSGCYRIALVDGVPAGFVGVIDDDIRICTHPDFQKKGVAKFMLTECSKIWPTAFGKVKIDNEASLKLFESCGFKKQFYILTKEQ